MSAARASAEHRQRLEARDARVDHQAVNRGSGSRRSYIVTSRWRHGSSGDQLAEDSIGAVQPTWAHSRSSESSSSHVRVSVANVASIDGSSKANRHCCQMRSASASWCMRSIFANRTHVRKPCRLQFGGDRDRRPRRPAAGRLPRSPRTWQGERRVLHRRGIDRDRTPADLALSGSIGPADTGDASLASATALGSVTTYVCPPRRCRRWPASTCIVVRLRLPRGCRHHRSTAVLPDGRANRDAGGHQRSREPRRNRPNRTRSGRRCTAARPDVRRPVLPTQRSSLDGRAAAPADRSLSVLGRRLRPRCVDAGFEIWALTPVRRRSTTSSP